MSPFRAKTETMIIAACHALKANVMLADEKMNIVYVNPALQRFLSSSEASIAAELPRFKMSALVGSNIDVFHRDPAHQRNMLTRLSQTHNATISVGGKTFDLVVTPLASGARKIGFVVEWADADARLRNLDYAAQIEAIGRNQAVIELTTEGVIVNANDRFLTLMNYARAEVVGRPHSILVQEEQRESADYQRFWQGLKKGEFFTGQFKRMAKGGGAVWIYGSYNPIPGPDGKIAKVVKFATDVTDQVRFVQSIGSGLAALARGDLNQSLDVALTPELEQVRADFNQAVATLRDAMRRMAESAAAVEARTQELRVSSQDLSSRSETQAASLEESAAALNEVTATVERTSEGAEQARTLVETAKSGAEKASGVMRETVEAMAALEKSSAQIAQIIGAIDEIAFQTNLLALNAGVEAARAGDSGRGFAVVASEVRALAQRSAEAAKQIKQLIAQSEQNVDLGVQLVGRTGAALDAIVGNVNEVTQVMNDIAESARSQFVSLKQVNVAIGDMNDVTQQTANMANQANAAAGALSEEAAQVVSLLGQFDVGEGGRSPPAASARPRRRVA